MGKSQEDSALSDYLPSEAELDALPHMGATTPAAPAPEAAKPRPQRGYQRADELPPHSTEAEAGVLGWANLRRIQP